MVQSRTKEEKTTMVWPRQKDARGENNKINYRMDTKGEKEKRTSEKKTWMEGVQAAMTTRNLEPDQQRGMAFGLRKTATAVVKTGETDESYKAVE
jgi:hypothetical protein